MVWCHQSPNVINYFWSSWYPRILVPEYHWPPKDITWPWYPSESGVWCLTFANQDLAWELICKEMNKQKRDIEYVNNVSTKLTINLIFELKCNNLDFESKFKKVIPKIASPQAKNSHIQTRSEEKSEIWKGQVGAFDQWERFSNISRGEGRHPLCISKKEALNVHL